MCLHYLFSWTYGFCQCHIVYFDANSISNLLDIAVFHTVSFSLERVLSENNKLIGWMKIGPLFLASFEKKIDLFLSKCSVGRGRGQLHFLFLRITVESQNIMLQIIKLFQNIHKIRPSHLIKKFNVKTKCSY